MGSEIKIGQILDSIRQVTMSPAALETLCEFERVIDESGLYAFHNWKSGELVSGPIISAYRVKCTFMWPLDKMPDPSGAERLLTYGCKISYRKAWLKYPIKVKTPSDYREGIKKPKIAKIKVWLVEINMPSFLMKEIKQSSEEIMDKSFETPDIGQEQEQAIDTNQDQMDQQNFMPEMQ